MLRKPKRIKMKRPARYHQWSEMERKFYHQLWKKRKAVKDLYLKNLLRTNIELMKNLDIGSSTLF
jgi:hypothetical protein